MSKAKSYISVQLSKLAQPIITIDNIENIIEDMYLPANRVGLFLRGKKPDVKDFKRYVRQLVSSGLLQQTARYGVYRVANQEALSTQEMISLADPYIYVAYLSAIQRWGLTNRNPKYFLFGRPNKSIIKSLKPELPDKDDRFAESPIRTPVGHESLHRLIHGYGASNIKIVETRYPARTMWLGGEHTRISTQASTFVDMLLRPDLCGGINHVIEVWETYLIERQALILDELINIIDETPSSILKVRAGYLISERLGLDIDTVNGWKRFAARGGSRKLDPDKPYKNMFSEEWMLSINV